VYIDGFLNYFLALAKEDEHFHVGFKTGPAYQDY
jgi:hypothetical protein